MMYLRAAPLALCLLWLAYESHFSPSFFASTIETSVTSILAGLDGALTGEISRSARPVVARAE